MAAYKKFARWYDAFMADIPYNDWADYVIEKLKKYDVVPRDKGQQKNGDIVLELGCGTGSMARYLCMEGYRVVGIDISADMIEEAGKKLIPNFEAYVADMRAPFLRSGSCKGIVSVCDSMNYLTSRTDLELTMKAAAYQLCDGGVFIFDMKTEEFYRDELGDNVFTDRAGRVSYVWENHYDEKRHINTYDITFYEKLVGRLCASYTERHRQRAYSYNQVKNMAKKCGLKLSEYQVKGERAYYILKK